MENKMKNKMVYDMADEYCKQADEVFKLAYHAYLQAGKNRDEAYDKRSKALMKIIKEQ